MSRNIDIFSEPYAIVFAGGGARGAWQIGVWKALREKFGNHAEAVSGTSVGALNAALYAMSPDDPTPAENIWTESIQKYPIITQWPELVNKVVTGVLATGSFIADLFSQQNKIRRSNEHLRSVIQEGIKGRTFHLPTYICAYDRNEKVSRFPQIDTDAMDEERRCEWLLASTAIPYIFPSIKIDGVEYSDGGFGWDHALRVKKSDLDNLKNVPLKPIEDLENIKNVFVLTLSQNEETFWQKANPDFNIIPIMPNKELGFALDFSKDHITEIMNQGFEDGQKWLKNKGRLIINAANLNQVHKIGEEIEACKKIFEGIKSLREELLADYNSEFKNALERYNNHKTEENKKELNGCSLLQFDEDLISKMRDQIISDIFGDDGLSVLKNKLEGDFGTGCEDIENNAKKLIALEVSSEGHENGSQHTDILAYSRQRKNKSDLPAEREEIPKTKEKLINAMIKASTDLERRLAMVELITLEGEIKALVDNFMFAFIIARLQADSSKKPQDDTLSSKKPQDDTLPDCLTPKRYPDFVGREDKLKELHTAIEKNRNKAIVLYGYPGNGKKTLVLEYAWIHQKEFPGGCFVIDAEGKKNFAEALRSLLDDHDICEYWNLQPDKIGAPDDIRTKTVTKNLKKDEKQKLIVLTHIDSPLLFDNDDEFGSFLDLKFITVIATTKKTIQNPIKCIQIEVPSLSPDDSITLLKKYCQDRVDDQMIQKIIKVCGGNPWALMLVGKKFHKNSDGSEYAEDNHWEQESVEIEKDVWNEFCSKIMKPVYESLKEDEKRFLMYAALLSYGKISGQWLFEIPGEKKSHSVVSSLKHLALIDDISSQEEKDNKIHWFEMLGNTREAVFQIADQNELQRCAEKLCKHIAENEMKNHTFSQEETLTLAKCFCEWSREPWKQKILPLLFSLSMHDDLGDYLSEYKMFDWRRKVCEAAEKIIDSMENGESKSKYRASCLIYRGHINFDCGKLDDALACYQESHEIRQKIFHDDNVVFLPLEYQATVHARKRNLDKAENIFKECESKFESYLDKEKDAQRDVRTAYETLARLYKRWADALSENEKKREAEEKYKQAVDCAEKASNTEKKGSVASILLGRFQRDLGVFYKKENEVEKAIECLEESIRTLLSLSSRENHPDVEKNKEDLKELYDELLKSRKEKETL